MGGGIQGKDHVGVIEKGKHRRSKQRKKEAPRSQHFGGSKEASDKLAGRDASNIEGGQAGVTAGLDTAYRERDKYQSDVDYQKDQIRKEREDYRKKTDVTLDQNEGERIKQLDKETAYGAGADQALGDYRAGRGDILGGAGRLEAAGGASADMLEGYAKNAAGEYQSAADAAFNASANRGQKNALALAAGRGPSAVRTALATAGANNQQAMLDQQATRAAEANQLNAMRDQAVAQAAGIRAGGISGAIDARTGLSAQDQAAAGLQAGREAGARTAAQQGLQTRGALEAAGADYQLKAGGEERAADASSAAMGSQLAGQHLGAAGGQRDSFLGAESARSTAQLGSDAATEAARIEHQKEQSGLAKAGKWTSALTLGILGSK